MESPHSLASGEPQWGAGQGRCSARTHRSGRASLSPSSAHDSQSGCGRALPSNQLLGGLTLLVREPLFRGKELPGRPKKVRRRPSGPGRGQGSPFTCRGVRVPSSTVTKRQSRCHRHTAISPSLVPGPRWAPRDPGQELPGPGGPSPRPVCTQPQFSETPCSPIAGS